MKSSINTGNFNYSFKNSIVVIHFYKVKEVLETKTISQAAKELGYSQSAVSQTIKSLEEELEATLFIRQKVVSF